MRELVHVVCEGGRPTKLQGFLIDVTDQRSAEQRVRELEVEMSHPLFNDVPGSSPERERRPRRRRTDTILSVASHGKIPAAGRKQTDAAATINQTPRLVTLQDEPTV